MAPRPDGQRGRDTEIADPEKFERLFVPAVLALAVLLFFAWVVIDEPVRDSFYRAIAQTAASASARRRSPTPAILKA